jgi:putative acetyltransferase
VLQIRDETREDAAAIRDVNETAFGGPVEGRLVDMLRSANKAVISLVAVDQGRVVGHILFSPVTIAQAPETFSAVGLAPLSVLPEFQNQGIGLELVRHGLEACKRKGYDLVVVLGHTHYYPRFGFVRARDYGLDNQYNALDEFMVLELKEGALQSAGGLVMYAPEFDAAGA